MLPVVLLVPDGSPDKKREKYSHPDYSASAHTARAIPNHQHQHQPTTSSGTVATTSSNPGTVATTSSNPGTVATTSSKPGTVATTSSRPGTVATTAASISCYCCSNG
ncbi:hypothetical protein NHX12_033018 [Muraenolepis orangiensis]|uniref:Uncharacterized protein n=1 Tax=Muraenolepis orangiensis TaxID=630683 RepID=A0A9Q0E1V8_9TELE|nr:hypothetical protein NHX12_033018 [Muraenolepis orangiensis]